MHEAEQSYLSCIIKKGDLIKEAALDPNHFNLLEHQTIFTAMKELDSKNQPIDIVSISTQIGQDILLIGGIKFLSDLYNSITNIDNFKTYEKYILDNFKIRKVKELTNDLRNIHSSKDIDKLNEMISEANVVLEQGEQKDFDLIDVLTEIEYEANEERADISGVPTGFSHLDIVLDGLKEEELTILGARPSVGKTAFSLALTQNILSRGHFVNFFSLEMSAKSLLYRMICSIGEINSMKMKNPRKRFNQEDWTTYRRVQTIIEKWKESLAIFDQSKTTVQDIRSKAKQRLRKFPDKRQVIIIDYLTLVQGNGRRERHLEIGEITRNLKRLARDLNVSIVLLSQLSRAVEQRKDKRPILSDLRDSGEIEQDADKILFLHRDDYYDRDKENNIVEVVVAKNRNGSLGTVELEFDKQYQKFRSVTK